MNCHHCGGAPGDPGADGKPIELRPYGPGGADVCFPCATETPEREQVAEWAFLAVLEGAEAASPHGAAVIGEGTGGPAPYVEGSGVTG